jgi:hypothetical protein
MRPLPNGSPIISHCVCPIAGLVVLAVNRTCSDALAEALATRLMTTPAATAGTRAVRGLRLRRAIVAAA